MIDVGFCLLVPVCIAHKPVWSILSQILESPTVLSPDMYYCTQQPRPIIYIVISKYHVCLKTITAVCGNHNFIGCIS